MAADRPDPLVRLLALVLLLGSLLLLCAAFFHPILPITAEGDLALIQSHRYWRLLHLCLLHATGMVIIGCWCRWLVAEPAERPGLLVGFLLLGIGQALNGVTIAFMTGAGTWFAAAHAAGTDVATIYQPLHLFAVMSGRLSGFLVSAAAGVIALATARAAREPRVLVWLAALASLAGLAGDLLAAPGHPLMLTSIGLLALWQVGTAARVWRLGRGSTE